MSTKRKIEIFTAGCSLCDDVVKLVESIACDSCDVSVYNLNNEGQDKARAYGIASVPTVVVDAKIADCCRQGKVSKSELVAAGIGKPIS
ncbi:MAG: thioredoxin family protein [Candidatus Scalinduaceae bacterium]